MWRPSKSVRLYPLSQLNKDTRRVIGQLLWANTFSFSSWKLCFISRALLQHHRIRCSLVHPLNYPHYVCRLRSVASEAGCIINTPLSFQSPAKCWYHSTVSSISGWFVNETALTRRLKGKKLRELPLDTHCPSNYYGSQKFPTSWPMTSLSINSALTLRVLM